MTSYTFAMLEGETKNDLERIWKNCGAWCYDKIQMCVWRWARACVWSERKSNWGGLWISQPIIL